MDKKERVIIIVLMIVIAVIVSVISIYATSFVLLSYYQEGKITLDPWKDTNLRITDNNIILDNETDLVSISPEGILFFNKVSERKGATYSKDYFMLIDNPNNSFVWKCAPYENISINIPGFNPVSPIYCTKIDWVFSSVTDKFGKTIV